MLERGFGQTDVTLSQITFGSMRFCSSKLSKNEAKKLINYVYDQGVNSFHTSSEYETDAFFCEVFREFVKCEKPSKIVSIVKIAEPHFDQNRFNPKHFRELVDERLLSLGVDRLEIVQWLLRFRPELEEDRIDILNEEKEEILNVVDSLVQEGKVSSVASYPYGLNFAKEALKLSFVQGLTENLNLLEREWAELINDIDFLNKSFIAIRPLAAGHLTNSKMNFEGAESFLSWCKGKGISIIELPSFAIQFPLLHPSVCSLILSVSSVEHANSSIRACESLEPNPQLFQAITKELDAVLPDNVTINTAV